MRPYDGFYRCLLVFLLSKIIATKIIKDFIKKKWITHCTARLKPFPPFFINSKGTNKILSSLVEKKKRGHLRTLVYIFDRKSTKEPNTLDIDYFR